MKLNKELRTKQMISRYRIKWVMFYLLALLALLVFGWLVYKQLDDNRLPVGHIELKVSKEKYQLNETIKFTVTNHFPTPIYVTNNCPGEPLDIYEWSESRWKQIHDTVKTRDSDCFKQPRRIKVEAEGSLAYDFGDWPRLFDQPGVYRIALPVEHYDELPFQDFVVLKPAEVKEVPETSTTNEDSTPAQTPTREPEDEEDEEDEIELNDD